MRIRAFAWTDVGRVRELNEDSHVVDLDAGFFAVADGMGGHAAGEVASAMAVSESRAAAVEGCAALDRYAASPDPGTRAEAAAVARGAAVRAHQAICDRAAAEADKRGMGTTLDCAVLRGGCAFVAHVGDSRVYLVRDGGAVQLTQDHSLIEGLLAAGYRVPDELRRSPLRSVLVNALGVAPHVLVDEVHVELAVGDRLLLCSDGLHEYFPDEEELAAIVGAEPADRTCRVLVDLACDRGGDDNATCVLICVDEATDPAVERDRAALLAALLEAPCLAELRDEERRRALRLGAERRVPADSPLPRVSAGDETAYLLIEGAAVAVDGGPTLSPGTLIYPGALVGDDTPEAPVVALEPTRVLALRRSDLVTAAAHELPAAAKLLAAARRLAELQAR